MIVSISRELGAGGRSVGEAIASALAAALLDERSIIEELSQRGNVPRNYVEEHVERAPSPGERFIADLAAATAMLPVLEEWRQSDDLCVNGVRALVIEYAQRGDVVVIGHGGVSLLGWRPAGIPVLAMLLRAGREWRIEQLARRFEVTEDEARRRIDRIDQARARYQRHYFDSDVYDCRQYDLVLNTETLGMEKASAIAVTAARDFAARGAAPQGSER